MFLRPVTSIVMLCLPGGNEPISNKMTLDFWEEEYVSTSALNTPACATSSRSNGSRW